MSLPAGFPARAPALQGRVVFEQQWRYVAFLHWEVDPAQVAPFLPAGTFPDCIDGRTYVGLVAFVMADAGLGRGMPVPWLGTFPETNVRLYSVDGAGRHGVVFRSLEATRLPTILAARLGYRLPYTWSRMRVRQRGTRWTYRSARRWPDAGPRSLIDLQVAMPNEPIEPDEVEVFLTARWGLHSRLPWPGGDVTAWTPNEHEPWTLYRTERVTCSQDLLAAAGLSVHRGPDLPVLWSPGVQARFGRPTILRPAGRSGV